MAEFKSFDGLVLHYQEDGPAPADGQVPVVLLHGFAASYEGNFVAPGISKALVDAGRHIIGLDARGHGLSSKPYESSAYEDDAMARDVVALFDHLGLSSADVVGYSMGAGNAMRFAQLDTRVRRLVLGGIGDDIGGPVTPEATERWNRRRQRIADAMLAEMNESTTDMARRFVRFAESTNADMRALGASQRARVDRPMGAGAAEVKVPTLVVCGDKDFEPHTLASRLPDGRAVVVSGDHLSAVGDPALAKAIVDFLAEV